MLQQRITKQFVDTLSHIQYGTLTLSLPCGTVHHIAGKHAGVHANLNIHDARMMTSVAAKGDIGLMESYRDGWWSSDDITNVLLLALANENALEQYIHGGVFSKLVARFMYLFNRNTLKGSKRNIHAHYDLGNEFYKLWLDPTMSYSSALYTDANDTLESAQWNKYDRMLDRLESSSGRLLEVGCGWGGLAERATTKHNFDVKGITLSHQQHDYATQRVGDNAKIALEDYRKQEGRYNHIVSIEMFEAVGEKFWPTYFGKMASLLDQKGKAMVQTITIDEAHFDQYRKSGDMIRSFIFPGGMLPTPTRFAHEAKRAGLRVTDSFAFGTDYATTLKEWLVKFDSQIDNVKKLGFDDGFVRVWRLYLAACIAGFATNRTNVYQIELQHA